LENNLTYIFFVVIFNYFKKEKSNHLDDTWLLPSGRIKSDYEDMTFADICRYEEWKHS